MIETANHVLFPLASWMISYFLQSTLILAAALLVTRFFFKRSARMRRQIILLAMLAPLATATLSSFWSTAPVKYHTNGPCSPVAVVPLSSATFWDWFEAEEIDLSVPIRLRGEDERTVVLNRSDMNRFLLCFILLWAWMAVVLVAGWRFVSKWKGLRGRLAGRREIQDSGLRLTADSLGKKAGMVRRVRLTASTGVRQVTAMGLSEICLPAGRMPDLERGEIKNILAHELTHLKNCDPLIMIGASLVNILLFFQPLNTMASRRLQEESEFLADEGALALTKNPDILASSLLKLARAGRARFLSSLAPGFSGRRPMLVERTRKILGWSRGKRPQRLSLPVMATAVAALVLAISVCLEGAVTIARFWDGSSFSPPDMLTDQSWCERKELKLVLPGGDRLHFKMSRIYIDTRSTEVCWAPHGDSSLILDRTTTDGRYKIEIRGNEGEHARKRFSVNGRSEPYDTAAVSLLRDALLVMIDND